MEAVAIPGARGIARGGDRDAFVGRDAGAGKLADDPAIRDLVVKHDWIAEARGLADAAKARP